ncbi:hypothetical protein NYA30BAC_04350 (plasmid) [Halomonas sp. NYA30]
MTDTKHTPKPIDQFTVAARRTDPLFGPNLRDFQPTIQHVIEMISIHGEPYDPPGTRQRISLSLRPDLVTEIQGMASTHDMPTSAMVDALLRVAIGDWHEWWNHNGGDAGPAQTGQEVDL